MNYLIISTFILLTLIIVGCSRVDQLFYYPDHTIYTTPAAKKLSFEEITFSSHDGTRLSGWFVPAIGPAKGTVLHLHGNAENMTSHFGFVDWLPAAGYNIMVFDYRGYGQSAGSPTRSGVYEDSCAALVYLRSRPDIDAERIIVFGQSLGAVQAINVVGGGERLGVRAVVVEAPFYSYRRIVRDIMGKIPLLSWFKTPLAAILIRDRLSAADYIDRIAPIPLLLIHGSQDEVIPLEHATLLFGRAKEPKIFWQVEGGSHISTFVDQGSPYRQRLLEFFAAAVKSESGDRRGPVDINDLF